MAIQQAAVKITGINPLLMNNPQCVDRFNPFTRKMAAINAKKTRRTDDDFEELKNLEIAAKLYFDESTGVYVPATWLTAAIAGSAFKTAKVSKADIRSGLFSTDDKIKLHYRGDNIVKTETDIIKNGEFHHSMILKQGQVRVMKAAPIFHDWSFETVLEFDDSVIDFQTLSRIIERTAKYGGFGDFRPTFGRAIAEVKNV